jgi:hypothetical protein
MDEKDPSGRECNNNRLGYRGVTVKRVKIMAIPHKKDKGLCSPTSASKKK